jgi:hypothetical protein
MFEGVFLYQGVVVVVVVGVGVWTKIDSNGVFYLFLYSIDLVFSFR